MGVRVQIGFSVDPTRKKKRKKKKREVEERGRRLAGTTAWRRGMVVTPVTVAHAAWRGKVRKKERRREQWSRGGKRRREGEGGGREWLAVEMVVA